MKHKFGYWAMVVSASAAGGLIAAVVAESILLEPFGVDSVTILAQSDRMVILSVTALSFVAGCFFTAFLVQKLLNWRY